MRDQAKKAFFGFIFALLIVLFSEVFFQVFNIPDRGIYEGDPATVWWLKPNLEDSLSHPDSGSFRLSTGEDGFRGVPPPVTGEWVLVLGCSTTFGWGVDDEKAWPTLLSQMSGVHIVNGGVPGWTTHQALSGLNRWKAHKPTQVLISYGVRDAQLASHEDKASQPTPFIFKSQLMRLFGRLFPPSSSHGTVPRVSLSDYKANLRTIAALFGATPTHSMVFPQKDIDLGYADALRNTIPALDVGNFDDSNFFDADPIHLNERGNQLLAERLVQYF